MIMSNFQVERLKALPQHPGEVWEGGLIRLPMWDWDAQGRPYRPWAAVWINKARGTVHMGPPQPPARRSFALALEALLEMATRPKLAGYRPGALAVNDSALAEHLGGLLSDANIEVRHEQRLEGLQGSLAEMPSLKGYTTAPGALAGKGVTLEAMRACEEAAAEFFRAAPWLKLNDGDLIQIASPQAPKGFAFVVVMGEGGRTYGLSFFASDKQFSTMMQRGTDYFRTHGAWSVTFDAITHLPFEDADLWEENDLPLADPYAYPLAYYHSPSGAHKRPNAKQLAFLEGLLRALAQTGEQEMDSGAWGRTIETSAGPAEYRLMIPRLLVPLVRPRTEYQRNLLESPGGYDAVMELMAGIHSRQPSLSIEATLEEALQTAGQSWEEDHPDRPLSRQEQAEYLLRQADVEPAHRMRVRLGRMALELDGESIEAYVQLAEASNDLAERLELYRKAMAVGQQVLSPAQVRRPGRNPRVRQQQESYIEAWAGLVATLAQLGLYDQAVEQGMALLEAQPKDEMEITYILVPCLLLLGRDERAREILARFPDDDSAVWLYGGALAAFRETGPIDEASQRLQDAIEADEYLGEYLAGPSNEPDEAAEPDALSAGVDLTREDTEQLGTLQEALADLAGQADAASEPPEDEPGQEVDEQLLQEAWAATPDAQAWLWQELRKWRQE